MYWENMPKSLITRLKIIERLTRVLTGTNVLTACTICMNRSVKYEFVESIILRYYYNFSCINILLSYHSAVVKTTYLHNLLLDYYYNYILLLFIFI